MPTFLSLFAGIAEREEGEGVILPACLANAPAEEALELVCELGRCAHCAGAACAEHDRCAGCGLVLCPRCDTEGGMPPTRFPGDLLPHPHNER